jgi:hypothetical protein
MSTVRVDNIKTLNSDISLFNAKAWVYFDRNAGVVSSFNVASVTSSSQGTYVITTSGGMFDNVNFVYNCEASSFGGGNEPEIGVTLNVSYETGAYVLTAPTISSNNVTVKVFIQEESGAVGYAPDYLYVVFF